MPIPQMIPWSHNVGLSIMNVLLIDQCISFLNQAPCLNSVVHDDDDNKRLRKCVHTPLSDTSSLKILICQKKDLI